MSKTSIKEKYIVSLKELGVYDWLYDDEVKDEEIFPEKEEKEMEINFEIVDSSIFEINDDMIQQHSFKKFKKKPICSAGVNHAFEEEIDINVPFLRKKYRKYTKFVKELSEVITHEVLHVLINRENGIPYSQADKRIHELVIYKLGY